MQKGICNKDVQVSQRSTSQSRKFKAAKNYSMFSETANGNGLNLILTCTVQENMKDVKLQ